MARPAKQAVPHKVKLLAFWEKDAATWFQLTEAIFGNNNVRDSCIKDGALANPTLCPGEGQGYFEPGGHLSGPHWGAEEPAGGAPHTKSSVPASFGEKSLAATELMEVMQATLPPWEPACHLFKVIFLPGAIGTWWPSSSSSLRPCSLQSLLMLSGMLGMLRRQWWQPSG